MNIVYISNSRLPTTLAHGLQTMQMCSAFVGNGNEVELMVPKRINPIKRDPFDYYEVKKDFKITRIPCADFLFLAGNKPVFLIQLFSFLFFCKLKLLFKNYGILYSREQFTGIFFKNVCLEIHSLPKKTSRFHLFVWRRAKALFVLTSFIKERLVNLGIDREKILVAPDAVNLEKFDIKLSKEEARKKLSLPLDKKLIGYVGMLRTLGMEKGIDIAIKALSDIKKSEIILVLVGGYEKDIEFYKNMARGLGMEDRIIFTGMVGHDLVPLYLKAFDVLIAPFPENEHYSFFMSPLKIFEYMASGRPIISTRLPSLLEVLANNSNSILVSPGSSSELGKAVIDLLKDGAFSNKLAEQALIDVKKYTWIKRAESIVSFAGGISKNKEAEYERENIDSFSSELSVKKYSKKYLRAGEEYVIKTYMPSRSRVLDVGCGTGRTTSYIAENGCSVIGVDISAPLIKKAKDLYPDINFSVMDARKLDFKDNAFDAVFFSFNGIDNLPSLEERNEAIKEMKRVLKIGGFLIYSSHNALAIPRTKTSFKIIFNNLRKLRIGPHWRNEEYDFGKLTQHYNNLWNEKARLRLLGFKKVEVIGNSAKILQAPDLVLAFLDKFPIYIAQK